MATDHPQHILMTTAETFSSINISSAAGSVTPGSNIINNQDGLELSGFVQHDGFILAVSKHRCVMNVSLSEELTPPTVIAGRCGEYGDIDGALDVARFLAPKYLVQNLIAASSYVIVDKSKFKNIDFVNKVVKTVKDLSNTTEIRDVAVSTQGVVFATTSAHQGDSLVSFSLIDPDSEMQVLNPAIISRGFVFASPLFGASLSSLTFIGDNMLAFTDSSNHALKIVQTMANNTNGILTICQPMNQSTIQFIAQEKQDQCNDSFLPVIVRAHHGKILVLSENRITVFNITESADETKTFDLRMLVVYVSYSSVVGVLSIIVICLSIKYHQMKTRYGHEKRRHGLDISFPLQDTGIYFIESPPSVAPRSASTFASPVPTNGSTSRCRSTDTDPPTDIAKQNQAFRYTDTDDSSIYETIPSKRASAISDDNDSFFSASEDTASV